MENLCLGSVLNIISQTVKEEKMQQGWTNQELIVNGIFSLFHPKTKKGVYYVLPPQCSLYFSFKKNVPTHIRRYILKHTNPEIIQKAKKKLTSELSFPIEKTANRIYKLALSTTTPSIYTDLPNLPKLELTNLEKLLSQKDYLQFLITVFFFVLVSVPNQEYSENAEIYQTLHFNEDIKQAITTGHYYDFYEHKVTIIPQMEEKVFKTIIVERYQIRSPKPYRQENSYFSRTYAYAKEEYRNNSFLTKLVINGIDYSDKLIVENNYNEKAHLPYEKKHTLKEFKTADYYTVEYVNEYISDFPIKHGYFKLLSPAKHFKVSVEIISRYNYKFGLSLKQFGEYNPSGKNIDMIHPNTSFSYFEIKDWLLPSSGYYYLVKPRSNFWQECLPFFEEAQD